MDAGSTQLAAVLADVSTVAIFAFCLILLGAIEWFLVVRLVRRRRARRRARRPRGTTAGQ